MASILPAALYNKLLVDHDATSQAEEMNIKCVELHSLVAILRAHKLEDDLEVHVLHRHFLLEQGEALVHTEIALENVNKGASSFTIDVAKAMKCPEDSSSYLTPVMWYTGQNGELVSYEYAVRNDTSDKRHVAKRISSEKFEAFGKDFAAHVWGAGLQHLISLKDKSCIPGYEYPSTALRCLFRVPTLMVTLQVDSGVIETGWAIGPDGQPEAHDGHKTHTYQTKGGTVASYHDYNAESDNGAFAIDPREIPTAYTDKMWEVAESASFETWCPVAC